MGDGERTVRGGVSSERHGADRIGCGELKRELPEKAREEGCPPDMGEDSMG